MIHIQSDQPAGIPHVRHIYELPLTRLLSPTLSRLGTVPALTVFPDGKNGICVAGHNLLLPAVIKTPHKKPAIIGLGPVTGLISKE
jgi:hypothetical protein